MLDIKNISSVEYALWAPSIIENHGRYFFFSAKDIQSNNEAGGIGVAVADNPAGPFEDTLGKPLINRFYNDAQPINQFVFVTITGSTISTSVLATLRRSKISWQTVVT